MAAFCSSDAPLPRDHPSHACPDPCVTSRTESPPVTAAPLARAHCATFRAAAVWSPARGIRAVPAPGPVPAAAAAAAAERLAASEAEKMRLEAERQQERDAR